MAPATQPDESADLEQAHVPSAAAAIERALLGDMLRTEVILIRHGQQAYRGTRSSSAHVVDPPLTAAGERQAQLVGEYLAGDAIDAVYSSSLRRAHETAGIVSEHLPGDLQPTALDELREVELFRGLPRDQRLANLLGSDRLEAAASEFRRTRRFDAFPQSETSSDLRARANAVLHQLVAKHESERIAVVAHGGVINSFLAEVLGIQADMFFFPAHASVTRVLFSEERWALYSANEISHLKAASLVTF
jgi:probable phosphoglycerate mutase